MKKQKKQLMMNKIQENASKTKHGEGVKLN